MWAVRDGNARDSTVNLAAVLSAGCYPVCKAFRWHHVQAGWEFGEPCLTGLDLLGSCEQQRDVLSYRVVML